jgi:hypothetical protein
MGRRSGIQQEACQTNGRGTSNIFGTFDERDYIFTG